MKRFLAVLLAASVVLTAQATPARQPEIQEEKKRKAKRTATPCLQVLPELSISHLVQLWLMRLTMSLRKSQ